MREVRHLINDLLIDSADDDSADETATVMTSASLPCRKLMWESTISSINKTKIFPSMLSTGAISPSQRRKPGHSPFSSLTYNPTVYKVKSIRIIYKETFIFKRNVASAINSRNTANPESAFLNKNGPMTNYSYGGGSSCSSITSLMSSSSPFRKHL